MVRRDKPLVRAALSGVLALASVSLAHAAPIGGTGGGPFESRCDRGSVMVGINGRAGFWIDSIQIVCASWNASTQSLGPIRFGKVFGGAGGHPQGMNCPGASAVQSWDLLESRGDGKYIQHIAIKCSGLVASRVPVRHARLSIGPDQHRRGGGSFGSAPRAQTCRPGYLAVGVRGRHGMYVDAVELLCAQVRI